MKKVILGIISVIVILICLFFVSTCHNDFEARQEALKAEQELLFDQELNDIMIPEEWFRQDGYEDVSSWWTDLIAHKEKYSAIASETVNEWGNYLTEEEVQKITEYSDAIQQSHSMKEINNCVFSIEIITAQAAERKQQEKKEQERQQQVAIAAGGFKSQGVINANGYRYTWYSSNDAYHKNTSQWTAGADGIYRDSNGYVVVASSSHKQGDTVPTPFGTGVVRDSGCAKGTIDIYTNF